MFKSKIGVLLESKKKKPVQNYFSILLLNLKKDSDFSYFPIKFERT